MKKGSHVACKEDPSLVGYLETRSETYWHAHYYAALASRELLGYAQQDFQKITELLEESLFLAVRTHLCAIASEMALLVGTLFFATGYYGHARKCFRATMRAAQEANHDDLQATCSQGYSSLR